MTTRLRWCKTDTINWNPNGEDTQTWSTQLELIFQDSKKNNTFLPPTVLRVQTLQILDVSSPWKVLLFPETVGQGLLHIVEKFGCLLSSQLRWGISMSHAAKKGSPYFVSLEMSRTLVPSATKTQKLKSWNLKFKSHGKLLFPILDLLGFFWMIFWQTNPQIPPYFPTFGGFGTSWAACAGASSVNLFLKDEHLGVQQMRRKKA